MIEVVGLWMFPALVGALIAVHTIFWLAPARGSPHEDERAMAWGHTLKMLFAETAHIGTLVTAWFSIELMLDNPRGWNWSLTTGATTRGIVLIYLIFWVQVVLTLNAVILRVTWERVRRAGARNGKGG